MEGVASAREEGGFEAAKELKYRTTRELGDLLWYPVDLVKLKDLNFLVRAVGSFKTDDVNYEEELANNDPESDGLHRIKGWNTEGSGKIHPVLCNAGKPLRS